MFSQKEPYTYELHTDNGDSILCRIIPSNRRSLSIRVTDAQNVTVRCPYFLSRTECIRCIEEKSLWIFRHCKQMHSSDSLTLSEEQKKQLAFLEKKFRQAAKKYIPQRVAYYHQITGGTYTNITIRNQKSRWGSCSSRGTLSFNYRLMLAPPEILDYVVVHELCHLHHMNHSKEFWLMVESILPDYKNAKRYLKEHGHELTLEHYLFSST